MKKVIGPEETIQMETTKPKKQAPQKGPKKVNRREDWSFKAIVISLVLILVPSTLLGISIYRAYRSTGKPIVGQRFVGDLDPSIDKKDIKKLEEALLDIDGVKDAEVVLKTATLRIYLETDENTSKDAFASKAETAEKILYSHLDKERYFTAQDTQLQYDFEIYVHRLDEENPVIFTRHKSSRMEKAKEQFLTDPLSKEMAEDLRERDKLREQEKEQKKSETPDIPQANPEDNVEE